jgi:hypothetical protein
MTEEDKLRIIEKFIETALDGMHNFPVEFNINLENIEDLFA